MITMIDTSRIAWAGEETRIILANASAYFGKNERIGILAAPGSGKSTLARLLSGIEAPDEGYILRDGLVSWPLGFAGAFHPDLTLADNILFLSDLIGQRGADLISFCESFGGIGSEMNSLAKHISPGVRLAAAMSLSLSAQYDMYIADETIGFGDNETRNKSRAMLEQRLTNAGLIFISRNPRQLSELCERFLVLIGGQLKPCQSPEVGAQALELYDKKAACRLIETESQPKLEA